MDFETTKHEKEKSGIQLKSSTSFLQVQDFFPMKKSTQRLLSTARVPWQKWNMNDTVQHSRRHTQHLYLPLLKQMCYKATSTWRPFGIAISSARAVKSLSGSSAQQHGLAGVEPVKGTGYYRVLITMLSQSDGIRSFIYSKYNVMTFHKTTVTPHLQRISEDFEDNFYSVFIRFKHQHLPDTVFYSKLHKISHEGIFLF